MPSDAVLKTINRAHRLLVKVSRGKLGTSTAGMPVVELTTIGRKSGRPHTVMLTSPMTENGCAVVVASRGGDHAHPAWYLNLRDNPKVEVAIKGTSRRPMTARTATAEERARMWPKVERDFSMYAGYQKKTDREIPLVILEP